MKIENILPSMNIGIYSKNIILKYKDTLLTLSLNSNNYDELFELKNKLINFEDFIFKDNNYNRDDYFSENIETYFIGIKGTISKGLTRYFNKIDFIKYQTNAYFIQSIDICKLD